MTVVSLATADFMIDASLESHEFEFIAEFWSNVIDKISYMMPRFNFMQMKVFF